MKLSLILNLCLSVVIGVAVLCVVKFYFTPKIGYVRVGALMEKYQGMLDASTQYEADLKVAQANMDTVRSRYVTFMKSRPSEGQARQADQEMTEFQRKYAEDMSKRRNELSKPAMDAINSYIADFGRKHGYKVILGATLDGNVLYAQESDDLTQQLLDDLNQIYKRNKK